jgi:hypothetical protein
VSEIDVDWEDEDGSLEPKPITEMAEIYEEFRRRGDAPECLRTFLYQQLGRILP